MLAFNIGTNQPSGILPKLLINLGGNIIYINLMVVQGPLDFNLLLVPDYVYFMGALVSSLFHLICFLHEGRIMTIDHLSFIGPNLSLNQPKFLNGPHMQELSSPPQVNYVATCSMPSSTDDLVSDIVHHVVGALDLDLSIRYLDMYPFQSVVLPFDENLLESMTSYGP